MAYDKKKHRNTHQLKSRLNDDDYVEFSIEASARGLQPGALARKLILAGLQFKRDYGYFPLIDDNPLEGFPALGELARERNMHPSALVHELIRSALQAKREQDAITQVNDKKLSA